MVYGLALEGGGAKGAYHLGAYKALRELGIEIGGVAGTSIGALNAAGIAQGDWELMYETWRQITPSQVFDIEDERLDELKTLHLTNDNFTYFMKKAGEIWRHSGLDITFIKRLLQRVIDEEKLRRSPMDYGLVTVSLSERKPLELFVEDIPEGKVTEYIMASANLPVFEQGKIDGQYFIDGGFFDNLPIRLLESKGYRDIIAVRTGAMGRVRKPENPETRVTVISSRENLGGLLDFSQAQAQLNLQRGYYDTLRVWQNLWGIRYYVTGVDNERAALEFFLQLPEEAVLKAGRLLGVKNLPWSKMLFEHILPHTANLLKLRKNAGYGALRLKMLELMAEDLGIERFQLYTIQSLTEAVHTQVRESPPYHKKEFGEWLSAPLQKNAARELVYALLFNDI